VSAFGLHGASYLPSVARLGDFSDVDHHRVGARIE
jgi:hypothetical protein